MASSESAPASEPARGARRLFFALWPEHAFQVALADAARSVVLACGGRPVPVENLHVTLAFLGPVPEARCPEVMAAAQGVANRAAGAPLELTLDAIEYWRKPKLVCAVARGSSASVASVASGASGASAASPVSGEAPADSLVAALKSDLVAAGFAPDLKPFRVHVTLARKVPPGSHDRAMQSVLWRFDRFALIDSRTGPEGSLYSVLNSWPLCTEVRKMPEKKQE